MNYKTMPDVKAGDPATLCHINDRYPVTVIDVVGKRITVQYDIAEHVSGSFYTNDAKYNYVPNPEGRIVTFSLRADGCFHVVKSSIHTFPILHVGEKEFYQNPCI